MFDPVDVLFAHLWLARASAFMDDFCRFFVDLSPRGLILTHFDKHGRAANDPRNKVHTHYVSLKITELDPDISVILACIASTIVTGIGFWAPARSSGVLVGSAALGMGVAAGVTSQCIKPPRPEFIPVYMI